MNHTASHLRILSSQLNCLPKDIGCIHLAGRHRFIPLDQHGSDSTKRIHNLCAFFQIGFRHLNDQRRRGRVNGC